MTNITLLQLRPSPAKIYLTCMRLRKHHSKTLTSHQNLIPVSCYLLINFNDPAVDYSTYNAVKQT